MAAVPGLDLAAFRLSRRATAGPGWLAPLVLGFSWLLTLTVMNAVQPVGIAV
jgi:hypothetical protein